MSDNECGHIKNDGEPCTFDAKYPDGKCGHHTNHEDGTKQGRRREAPSKSTEENIASVIESGGSIREACRRAGVHQEQFYRWMQYGEEEEAGPFADFRERLVRARGEGEAKYRDTLMMLAEETGDTATLMAMLKQRYPDSWGEVDRGEQQGGVVVNVNEVDEYEVDPDTLEVKD